MIDADPGPDGCPLYERLPAARVRCNLCPHRCEIDAGQAGACGVRVNRGGALFLDTPTRGIVCHVDPIEKKPFYHFLPGSMCYSVGVPGCNMSCPYCINWELSQPLAPGNSAGPLPYLLPEDVVSRARSHGCSSIAFTYTEPVVFFEYALETARRAKTAGLASLIKTNGFALPRVWAVLAPFLDAANVDLKSMRDRTYRQLGGQLQPVLGSLRELRAAGVWVEVTTLVVPGQNDSDEELAAMARFIASELGPDTPWHLLRFFPHYQM
jgi:pyruvate formate lyase activating enzyme